MAKTSKTTCYEIDQFIVLLSNNTAVAGLDIGSKTVGIAISDTNRIVATPHKTIERKQFSKDVKLILNIEKEWALGGYIIGLPKNMDGSEGPMVQSIKAFGYNLSKHTALPITFWDERLSSVSAEKYLLESDTSRKKRKKVIDSIAASIILQNALDYFNHKKDQGE